MFLNVMDNIDNNNALKLFYPKYNIKSLYNTILKKPIEKQ